MLYELIQNAVLPNLQALNSIERLGGLVKVVSSEYQDANGRIVRQSFPVAAGVSYADCFNGGMYQSLCPDSSKKSVAFFREKSATYRPGEGARGYTTVLYQVQFAAWFNLKLLGISEPFVPMALTWDIINAVTGKYDNAPDTGITGSVTWKAINQHSPQSLFSEYTFGQDDSLFMYPYSFLGIDFEVSIGFDPKCLTPFTIESPINCQIV